MTKPKLEVEMSPGLPIQLLTIMFIGLKLTGHIDWSWWWVLSPIWGMFALMMALGFIMYLIARRY